MGHPSWIKNKQGLVLSITYPCFLMNKNGFPGQPDEIERCWDSIIPGSGFLWLEDKISKAEGENQVNSNS